MEGGSQASVIGARSPHVVRHRNGSAVRVEGTNVTPGRRSPQLRRPERLHGRVGPMRPILTFIAAAALVSAIAPSSASAQVAPTASEAAAYTRLHAAAHRGDMAELRKRLAAGANLEQRDGHGRTPL